MSVAFNAACGQQQGNGLPEAVPGLCWWATALSSAPQQQQQQEGGLSLTPHPLGPNASGIEHPSSQCEALCSIWGALPFASSAHNPCSDS